MPSRSAISALLNPSARSASVSRSRRESASNAGSGLGAEAVCPVNSRTASCYVTYVDVIAATKIHDVFGTDVHFEIFREDHKPPLRDLCDGLQDG